MQALYDFSAQPNGVKSAVWNEISKVIDSYVISPKASATKQFDFKIQALKKNHSANSLEGKSSKLGLLLWLEISTAILQWPRKS